MRPPAVARVERQIEREAVICIFMPHYAWLVKHSQGTRPCGTALQRRSFGMILHLRSFLLLLSLPTGLFAQEIPRTEYAGRRDSLLARVDSGVVIAFGAPDPVGSRRWSQHPAFRYLTGFLEPNAVLVLVRRAGTNSGTLFTASRDPRRALYDGFPPDSAAVARETGLSVRSLPALRPTVDSLLASGLPLYDVRDFATADAASQDTLTRGSRFVADVVARNPKLVAKSLHPALDSLRR